MEMSALLVHLVSLCCILVTGSHARSIVNTTAADMKCMEIRPGMQQAFGFHCFTPVADDYEPNAHWSFGGESLSDSDKYHMGMRQYESYFNGEMLEVYDMHLIITDVGAQDVGEYGMSVDMGTEHMQKNLMLPAALACGNHPLCYEDNCSWPERLTCRSIPQAYCQMDMCGGNLCMPRWFVGAAEVTCDQIEAIPYHT